MKVNPAIEDSLIPMEAEDFEALQEAKRKRNEHWLRMRRARAQFLEDLAAADCSGTFDFWQYLEANYGLIPERDDQGNIKEGFAITDEKLYTMFLLKFGQ